MIQVYRSNPMSFDQPVENAQKKISSPRALKNRVMCDLEMKMNLLAIVMEHLRQGTVNIRWQMVVFMCIFYNG